MGVTTARRRWSVDRDGRHYDVEMEDEYFLGRRVVRVNGAIAYEGRSVLSDHSGLYRFDCGGPAFLRIATNGFTYAYDVVVDGRSVASGKPLDATVLEQTRRSPPGWAWAPFALAFALLSVAQGNADGIVRLVGSMIGAGAAAGALGAASDRGSSTERRALAAAVVCVVGWALFGLLLVTRSNEIARLMWIGGSAGLLAGVLPSVLFTRKQRARLAAAAEVASIAAGVIAGLILAAPVAVGFTVVALRTKTAVSR